MTTRDELISRAHECQEVVDSIEKSKAWKVLLKDLKVQKQNLDDNWQFITDEKKVSEARITKMALMHVLSLPMAYTQELANIKKMVEEIDNPEEKTHKDYDLETNMDS